MSHRDTGITVSRLWYKFWCPELKVNADKLWSVRERATTIIPRLENNFKMRFQLLHLFCLSKRLRDDLVIAIKYPWKTHHGLFVKYIKI